MAEHDAQIEQLIERLSRDVRPVKRPTSPWRRTLGWMLLALPCGFLATLLLRHEGTDWSQPGAAWAALEVLLSLCLGALAVATAFDLGIAGRRAPGWRWFAPLLVAWLVAALAGMAYSADPLGRLGEGLYCYVFMLLAGLPMLAMAVVSLRRTRALRPERSLLIAGLGSAATTQCLLGLCHPVAAQLFDLMMHLAAAATLALLAVLAGRRWVAVA